MATPAGGRARPPYARRRLTAFVILSSVVACIAGASGLLPSVMGGSPQAGATPSHLRIYTVRPGDTLWGIAAHSDPGRDPRPLVAELSAQIHGAELQPGSRLVLP